MEIYSDQILTFYTILCGVCLLLYGKFEAPSQEVYGAWGPPCCCVDNSFPSSSAPLSQVFLGDSCPRLRQRPHCTPGKGSRKHPPRAGHAHTGVCSACQPASALLLKAG